MKYIKQNKTLSDNIQGRAFIYENSDIRGPKILLNNGWSKLSEFVEVLRTMRPLKPLEFNPNLCLEIPSLKSEWSKKEKFLKLIEIKKMELDQDVKVSFHFDIGYNNAETSAILQLVDDNSAFKDVRRKNILNENNIQVGITNIFDGKKNCAYLLFLRKIELHKITDSTAYTNSNI